MIEAAQIEKMTAVERLQAIEQLWESLTDCPERVNSPAWHGEVLAGRKQRAEQGEAVFLTLDQLRQRLRVARP
jgi:hypothetical protein